MFFVEFAAEVAKTFIKFPATKKEDFITRDTVKQNPGMTAYSKQFHDTVNEKYPSVNLKVKERLYISENGASCYMLCSHCVVFHLTISKAQLVEAGTIRVNIKRDEKRPCQCGK